MAKTFAERIRETQDAVAANVGELLAQAHKSGKDRTGPRKTQVGLAARLHVSQTTISRWIHREHPIPPQHFEAIAEYFGCSVLELSTPPRTRDAIEDAS